MIIEFLASLPDVQTAIAIGGDGARIKLDIPETDLPNVIKLVLLKGKLLKIRIEDVEENKTAQPSNTITAKDLLNA
jgi:hypothetical protein